MPGIEIGLQALGGAAAKQVAIPEPEPVELGAVRGVERCEVAVELARVEQAGLELAERAQQLVGEAAEARRCGEAVERRGGKDAAHEQCALRLRDDWPRASPPAKAMRSKTSSNVSIEPPRSAGRRLISWRETYSTSDRFGTMRTGSRSRASR